MFIVFLCSVVHVLTSQVKSLNPSIPAWSIIWPFLMRHFQKDVFCLLIPVLQRKAGRGLQYNNIYHQLLITALHLNNSFIILTLSILRFQIPVIPGSSCNLSWDIFSSWTEISSSPETCTPLTLSENSHSFLHPVQCRRKGSTSEGNWNTRCFRGIFTVVTKVNSAGINFICLHRLFLKERALCKVMSWKLSFKMKDTIALPSAMKNNKKKHEPQPNF